MSRFYTQEELDEINHKVYAGDPDATMESFASIIRKLLIEVNYRRNAHELLAISQHERNERHRVSIFRPYVCKDCGWQFNLIGRMRDEG